MLLRLFSNLATSLKPSRLVFFNGPDTWPNVPEPDNISMLEGLPLRDRRDLAKDVAKFFKDASSEDLFKKLSDRVAPGAADSLTGYKWKESSTKMAKKWEEFKNKDEAKMFISDAKEKGPSFYLSDYVSVALLQAWLKKTGFAPRLGIDGVHGTNTEAAISAFQRRMDINVDGQFGPKTFEAMKKYMRLGTADQAAVLRKTEKVSGSSVAEPSAKTPEVVSPAAPEAPGATTVPAAEVAGASVPGEIDENSGYLTYLKDAYGRGWHPAMKLAVIPARVVDEAHLHIFDALGNVVPQTSEELKNNPDFQNAVEVYLQNNFDFPTISKAEIIALRRLVINCGIVMNGLVDKLVIRSMRTPMEVDDEYSPLFGLKYNASKGRFEYTHMDAKVYAATLTVDGGFNIRVSAKSSSGVERSGLVHISGATLKSRGDVDIAIKAYKEYLRSDDVIAAADNLHLRYTGQMIDK